MAVFQAFRALRPTPEKAERVAALPYDVVTEEEARETGDKNPFSFLHVDRGRSTFQKEPIHMTASYTKKQKKIFLQWRQKEPLFRMRSPAIIFMSSQEGEKLRPVLQAAALWTII